MILRYPVTFFWFLVPLIILASAQPDSDCHISIGDNKYDFSALSGDHTVSRTRSSPPTNVTDTLRFNICKELSPLDGVDSSDQCSTGTWACLTKTNIKEGESDRIVAVIPIARESELRAEYTALSSPRGVRITLHGPSYPSSTTLEPTPQAFVLNLLCATDVSKPEFKSYDGALVMIEWSAPSGCGFRSEAPAEGGGDTPEREVEAVGSGIGWFFLLLCIAFAAYFALGAYHNYTTYGATGVDLIPHRDFWREVPYMLRDVVSHLCSSFQSRHSSSRGGYISV
ncbi:autophagy-related protein 27 [Multifurca ochricompacta]|uniref:Autophagy-related protein 27 n=1 Tax=Multifurca ochricompacta TaxID=376703 RepID=A0AAD4QQZ2_9AGAM|nr:autophagy-related protein 27 [Multifurca ochricompacta]